MFSNKFYAFKNDCYQQYKFAVFVENPSDNHILQSINLILYLNFNYKPLGLKLPTNITNILSKLNIVIPKGKTPVSYF